MLESKKVAPLAFALKTLYFFGNPKTSISKEIQAFIEKKLPKSNAGFRPVVKQI